MPAWARETTTPLAFIHLVDALFNVDHLIRKGTILLFDEYVTGRQDHEHRALLDWARKFDRQFEYLWRSNRRQVCVRIG